MTKLEKDIFFYENLWAAYPYPTFLINDQNKIDDANGAAEVFWSNSTKNLIGSSIATFIGENKFMTSAVNQARNESISISIYDVEILLPNKESHIIDVIAVPVNNLNNRILLIFNPHGMSKKMNKSLSYKSAARSVTGMAETLAHEIKNPLTGISGAAQLLFSNVGLEEKEWLDIILKEANRIKTLVDKFQIFGDIRPVKQDAINIHDILSQAKRAADVGYAANIKIIEDYDPSLPAVRGDRELLLQVIQNLLKNAAEAVPESGGKIIISTSFRQGIRISVGKKAAESLPLQVCIIDNGPGVPEQIKDEIFEPFVSSKINGTGLGLSLVSKIVSDLGGVIEYSRLEQKSLFTLSLPRSNSKFYESLV